MIDASHMPLQMSSSWRRKNLPIDTNETTYRIIAYSCQVFHDFVPDPVACYKACERR